MRLEGKVAVVTGGAQGLGRAYAERFAGEGAAIGIIDLRDDDAQAAERAIRDAGGKALAVHADVTNEAEMAAAAKRIADEFGRIDVLVNNAALYGDMNIADQSIAYFQKLMHVNVVGLIVASRAVFPYLKQAGRSSIINISSTAAYPLPLPRPGELDTVPVSGYVVSKAAVISLTKSMAMALGATGIRVNAIAPGLTMTDATKKIVPQFIMDNITEATALRRALQAEDLTGAALFLASEDSALITGQVIVVDGGLIMLG
jgi:NAD(P)-dependent dehydrogenase (short-subunit alcohol dehydrogenase family)